MLPHVKPFENSYLIKEPVILPEMQPGIKKTLIFDIDETMIHCLEDSKH
jgi:hypothetical protein